MYLKPVALSLFLLFLLPAYLYAQDDDLMDILEQEEEEPVNYTIATFKATRVINGQSVETNHNGVLQFLISHRFGRLSGGAYELFGLDDANIRLGFSYGITDNFEVGIGRSSLEKTYDGYLKYKLLRQSTGRKKMPFTLTLFTSMAINTTKWEHPDRENYFTSRLYYTYQVLLARKFTENLSLQLSPTLIHRNIVPLTKDKNDVFALGFGGRYKLTGSLSVNAEYFWVLPDQIFSEVNGEAVRDALSIGIDIETGGHVFQLHFTNSRGIIEKHFITETIGEPFTDDEPIFSQIHFGFNISRVFNINRKNGPGEEKKW